MAYTAPTQTNQTISQNSANWTALHTISNEQADKQMAEYKAERRIKAIRRYLRERSAR